MQPFTTLTSSCVVLATENVDTDQIIPARFLKTIDRRGLGEHLFADWRMDERGQPRADFPLNGPDARTASILVAGHNFGCGSSREHAPWALLDFGFRAIISTGFADIFRNNALKNGLLPVALDPDSYMALRDQLVVDPRLQVTIDLSRQALIFPDGTSHSFPVDPFARHCLLNGVDELGFLLNEEAAIAAYESSHGPRISRR
jgi:3-isopropylmalate/(R)-2-methylmalate dehydratase small subunit